MKGIMTNEYWDRLDRWLHTLVKDLYLPLGRVNFEGFTTYDMLSLEEAAAHAYAPVDETTCWGHTWEYMWLRGSVVLPEEARGKQIALDAGFEGEAAMFVNGKAFGTCRADWVEIPHHFIVDNFLTTDGKPGDRFDCMFEVYAGHYFPDEGAVAVGPVIPDSFHDPLKEGERRSIGVTTYGIWNEDAYQLYLDVMTLKQLYPHLPEHDTRAVKVADALERFTHIAEFEQDLDGRIASYKAAREALRPALEAVNGSDQATFYAIGNAHLDLAWLWPHRETVRKTARTFAQQLRLIERYPEYKYIQSQPAAYEFCRDQYPELFERIKAAVKKGQWIADGAMYVEPDTNMSSGEALIRQLLYGKRFYQDELGVDSKVLWLPDTFGYTAALPQILKGCGVDYLVTQKIFWSYNDSDRFPYHYFTWKGMDGSEVISFLPTNYTYKTHPDEICKVWESRVQTRDLDGFLLPFGYGDGGGGPTRDHIEYILREGNLQGMPKVEMTSPEEFFHRMEENGKPANTWDGELYFSAHRGTYTNQALVKKNNRLSEQVMMDVELWGTLANLQAGKPVDKAAIDRMWKVVLLNQFHDILPGSSIGKVYEEANAEHAQLQAEAESMVAASLAAMADGKDGLTFYNPLSWDRQAVVALDERFADGAMTADGQPVPVCNGLALITVPAMGRVSVVPAAKQVEAPLCCLCAVDGGYVMENDVVTVTLDAQGRLTCWQSKQDGSRFAGLMNDFRLFKDVPRKFDAWDIDSMYVKDEVALDVPAQTRILVASGLEVRLERVQRFSGSVISQQIALKAGDSKVYFENEVDWNEMHKLLKVRFQSDVHARNALHEMQFGCIERPTHRSNAYDQTRFEVCNHRYTALCESGRGMAVLNDSKYGVATGDGMIELTLLRAAFAPDMEADRGHHSFTYAFTGWSGAFLDAPVVRHGYELNRPVRCAAGTAPTMSLLSIDKPNVIVETVKTAEDGSGDLILRLYESKQTATECTLTLNLPVASAAECNMLEAPQETLPVQSNTISLHFRAFEIKTLRVKRG